ncbi:MAG: hypothetical protein FDZ70_07295, partial [Actinobacteria bacterium]
MRKDCPSCGRAYAYDLPECTFCRAPLEERAATQGRVVAVTMVNAPSVGHEDVPYWTALVESADGVTEIVKCDAEVWVGDEVPMSGGAPVHREPVGVVGSGVMGRGLVELLLTRGHHVAWVGRDADRLAKARARVIERLGRVMDDAQVADCDARLVTATDPAALSDRDVVIEAVAEDLAVKLETYLAIEP